MYNLLILINHYFNFLLILICIFLSQLIFILFNLFILINLINFYRLGQLLKKASSPTRI